MIRITLGYGLTRRPYDVVAGTNVGCIRNNNNYAIALGFGREDQVVVNGVPANDATVLSDGDVVSFVTRAHEKAAA